MFVIFRVARKALFRVRRGDDDPQGLKRNLTRARAKTSSPQARGASNRRKPIHRLAGFRGYIPPLGACPQRIYVFPVP